tara:strand:- start:4146 stop:4841 length:696 start_codon:yes stop_codon:yes gene_type:complete
MTKITTLISDSWLFYKKHFFALCALLIPFIIPISIVSSGLEFAVAQEWYPESISWLVLALDSAIYPIYQGAIILYIASALTGDYLKRSECYRLALTFYLPLLGIYILGGAATVVGFMILIIPGLIVVSRLSFANLYCLLDKSKAMDALNSSWENTKNIQWLILSGILILAFAINFPLWLVEYLLNSIEFWNPVFSFISEVIGYLLAPLIIIFVFRVFTLEREKNQSTTAID